MSEYIDIVLENWRDDKALSFLLYRVMVNDAYPLGHPRRFIDSLCLAYDPGYERIHLCAPLVIRESLHPDCALLMLDSDADLDVKAFAAEHDITLSTTGTIHLFAELLPITHQEASATVRIWDLSSKRYRCLVNDSESMRKRTYFSLSSLMENTFFHDERLSALSAALGYPSINYPQNPKFDSYPFNEDARAIYDTVFLMGAENDIDLGAWTLEEHETLDISRNDDEFAGCNSHHCFVFSKYQGNMRVKQLYAIINVSPTDSRPPFICEWGYLNDTDPEDTSSILARAVSDASISSNNSANE